MSWDWKTYSTEKEHLLAEIEQLIQELTELRQTEQKERGALATSQLENKLKQFAALRALKHPS